MAPRTKILHAAKALGLGGTEKVLQLFATFTDRQRYDVAVYSMADGERGRMLREAGIATHVGRDLLTTLERLSPDVVHVHRGGWPEPELLRPIKLARGAGRTSATGRPLPALVETNVFGRHDPSPLAKLIDRHLYVSRFCKTRLEAAGKIARNGADAARHDVVYNPVDTDFLAGFGRERDFSRPVIGRLSRPDPGKWSPLALEFLPALAQAVPDLAYRIVGGTDEARAFVAHNGLEEVVEFLPPLTSEQELGEFLASVCVLAHANDTGESFGLAIAEAMATGLPVVTHPCPPPRDNAQLELVDHETTGLVARSPREYGTALARLLGDPALARAMGEAGRAKAQREYRAQTVVRHLESIYDTLLHEPATA